MQNTRAKPSNETQVLVKKQNNQFGLKINQVDFFDDFRGQNQHVSGNTSPDNSKMWKFRGKELIIKKPNSKYRTKYTQSVSGSFKIDPFQNKDFKIFTSTMNKNSVSVKFNQTSYNNSSSWSYNLFDGEKPKFSAAKAPVSNLSTNPFPNTNPNERMNRTMGQINIQKNKKSRNTNSPVFIRRSLHMDQLPKLDEGLWTGVKQIKEDDCAGIELEEYIKFRDGEPGHSLGLDSDQAWIGETKKKYCNNERNKETKGQCNKTDSQIFSE